MLQSCAALSVCIFGFCQMTMLSALVSAFARQPTHGCEQPRRSTSYQVGRHSRRSSRHCCPDPDCQPHCCCAPQVCRDHALSALGAGALLLRGALASLLRAALASFLRAASSSRSRLACASFDIRRYWVSITLPLRSTRKHSENAFPRPLCASPDSRSTDLHASWPLASGDGGASATFDAA